MAGCADMGSFTLPWDKPTPAEEVASIRAVLRDVHRGMATQSPFKVLAHVSHAYRDDDGREYKDLRDYLRTIFSKYSEVQIRRADPRVIVAGAQARAVEVFETDATPRTSDVPEISLMGEIDVYLVKEDGAWRIVKWGRMR